MPNPLPSGTKRLYEVGSLLFGEGEAVAPRSFLGYMGSGSRPVDGHLMVIQGAGYWGPDISAWLDVNLGPDEVQVKTRDDGRNGGWEYWIIGRKWSIYVGSGSPSPPDRRTEQMLLSLIRQVD